jgi:hypothetical protein
MQVCQGSNEGNGRKREGDGKQNNIKWRIPIILE